MWEFSTGGTIASVAGGFWLAAALEYFGISWEVLAILSVLLALDYVFGVLDAYLLDRASVTSTKMRRGLAKKLTRWVLPMIVIIILKWVWANDIELASTIIFSILIITEWYSIIGHIYSINTWEKLPEIDALKLLFEFIANLLKWKLPSTKEEEKKEEE